MMREVDKDGEGNISFGEFWQLVMKQKENKSAQSMREEARNIFKRFDVDGSGPSWADEAGDVDDVVIRDDQYK